MHNKARAIQHEQIQIAPIESSYQTAKATIVENHLRRKPHRPILQMHDPTQIAKRRPYN